MRKRFSFITSLLIHLLLIIVFLLTNFEDETVKEDEYLEINLIKKENLKSTYTNPLTGNETNIISGSDADFTPEIDQPEYSNYIDVENMVPDDINTAPLISRSGQVANIRNDFESSLLTITPSFLDDLEEESDLYSISWEGDKRTAVSSTEIDFSSFPSDSFTGVGVKVSFSVNNKGEVFDVLIIPPGSGSVEFDILIKSNVSRFSFNEAESISRGEVNIVYKR